MLISEIIKTRIKPSPKVKAVQKRKMAIKGPYAPPPKPLPKPKPIPPTPLQLKQKQQKNLQTYIKAAQAHLPTDQIKPSLKQLTSPAIAKRNSTSIDRDDYEKDAFLGQLRGEAPRKPL